MSDVLDVFKEDGAAMGRTSRLVFEHTTLNLEEKAVSSLVDN